MLLLLLCTSLQSSIHIATTLENLSTEVHDLASQVANLDLSPQPPNLAPVQASLRDIAACLPSAAQPSFPPQRPNVALPATNSSAKGHPTPTGDTESSHEEKEKGRPPPAPPPPPSNTFWPSPSADPDLPRFDMSTSLLILYSNPEAQPANTPTPGKRRRSPKGNSPQLPPGHPATSILVGGPPPLWPSISPPRTLRLSRPPLRGRQVVRRKSLSRPPPLRLCRMWFLQNLPLPSPKLSAYSFPPEPLPNPIRTRSRLQPTSLTSLPVFSERPIVASPSPSPAQSTTEDLCHCYVPISTLPPSHTLSTSLPSPQD